MTVLDTWIRRGTILIGGVVLVLMVLQVVVDVFLRPFLGAGVPATPDIVGKYYMVAVSFLPIAYTEIERRHIEATIFTEKLKGKARQGIYLLAFLMGLAVYALLFYGTFDEAVLETQKGAYMEVGVVRFITWPSYWILPFAFGGMMVILAMRVISVLTGKFSEGPHDPLEEISGHVEGEDA